MKFYGIDQDIYAALLDLITEAYEAAKVVGDQDSVSYYSFLLGELEEAKVVGHGKKMDDAETARMMKLQRYLRMLHEGLKDPKDTNKKKRRRIAKEAIEPKVVKIPKTNKFNKVSLKDF